MKKHFAALLVLLLLAGGCSWINPLSDEGEKTSDIFRPNEFLWQAAKDKLSFMTIVKENRETGVLETGWSRSSKVTDEEFRIEAKVLSTELRSDCLQVKVYRRVLRDGNWVEAPENYQLNQEVETAILNKARILYRQSLAI